MKKMKVSGQFVQQNKKRKRDKQKERNTGCKDKRNEKQKYMSMSKYGVLLIRSCEEVNCISYLLEDLLYTFWLG